MLEAPVVKIAHNAPFEMLWTLHFFGKRAVRPRLWGDSLAQAFLLDSRPRAHSLDHLCQIHFGLPLKNGVQTSTWRNLDDEPLQRGAHLQRHGRQILPAHCSSGSSRDCRSRGSCRSTTITWPGWRRWCAASTWGCRWTPRPTPSSPKQYTAAACQIERKLPSCPEVQAFEPPTAADFNVGSPKHVAAGWSASTPRRRFTTDEKALPGSTRQPAKAVLEWRGVTKVLSHLPDAASGRKASWCMTGCCTR